VGTKDLREREPNELEPELKPILDLATEYLNHLLIASMFQCPLLDLRLTPVRLARNPGGKKTPQDSTHTLLDDATIDRKQSALKHW